MKDVQALSTVTENGIRYHSSGPVNGLPMTYVLVHGIGTSLDFWTAVVPELASDSPVYALDLPGSGKSEFKEGIYDLKNVAVQTLSALQYSGIETMTLVGHSLGALVTLQMASMAPEKIDRLVLVDPVLFDVEAVLTNPLRALRSPILLAHTLAQFAGGLIPGHLSSRAMRIDWLRRAALAAYSKEFSSIDARLASLAVRNVGGLRTLRPIRVLRAAHSVHLDAQFRTLQVPTSVIHGEYDPLLTTEDLRRLDELDAVDRVVKLPRCGHLPMLEDPVALAAAIQSACR